MISITDHFELGMLGPNTTGISMTKAPERWVPTWENNRDLVLMAEEAGLEFHLPIGRWRGMAGQADPLGTTLDPITWSAGLAALTRRITIFTTIHTPFIHPVVAAKQLATLDQISQGRIALNLVSGWHQAEYDMFGVELLDHDLRYELSREWVEVVNRAWSSEEPFDFRGRFFQLQGVLSEPRPQRRRIPLMSAGASRTGRQFATDCCDFLYIVIVNPEQGRAEVEAVQRAARQNGRSINVYANTYVVCRPSQKEADEFHHYFAHEMADWEATDNLMQLLGMSSQSFPPDHYQLFRNRFAGGHGNYPIVGDPDHVAGEIKRIRDAGFRGMTLAFVDYAKEFEYFRDEVMPRLVAMGVRRPTPREEVALAPGSLRSSLGAHDMQIS